MIPIDINERREQLLKRLKMTSSSLPVTVNNLAELLHVSARTVHSDLNSLEEELKEDGWRLVRKSRKGIWMESIDADAMRDGGESAAYVFSRQERRDRIILALLGEEKQSVDGLADLLSISRNTLLADLKDVQETLEKRGLTYDSKRGLGIWAHGAEQETRDMLIHIFAKAAYDFRKYSLCEDKDIPVSQEPFREYAVNLPVEGIAGIFLDILRRREILENDAAANRMICALAVQLQRLRQGHRILHSKQIEFLSNEGDGMMQLAEDISSALEQYHPDFRKTEEIRYIMRELLHSKIFLFPAKAEQAVPKDVNVESIELARRFIEYAQVWLGDIYLDDEELIHNLALHLQPAIERAHFGIVLTNPLLGQIQDRYRSLFEVTRKAAAQISDTMGIHFSEDEIGYLTIHLGAAAERKRMRQIKKLSVLLICGNGVGTANLLAMTLKNNLQYIHIVRILSFYKLEDKDLEGIDLIISTMPLEINDIAVLRVSPIMTEEEIKVIEGQIQYFYNKKYASIPAEGANAPVYPGLADLLNESTIALDEAADDWEEAVQMGGRLLLEAGAVTQNYVDCMVRCVRKMGPYIVVCPGVAMPHARYEDGVHKVAVSFLRLKRPVVFDTGHEPVSVDMFFSFSTTDEKSHLRMLQDLWRIFSDGQALARLKACSSRASVLKFIQLYLKEVNPC